jgi:hypothetical protein
MKKQHNRIDDYFIKKDQSLNVENNNIKTTNINILLNRVREEKKNKSKKKIILSLSVISALFFLSMIVFTN